MTGTTATVELSGRAEGHREVTVSVAGTVVDRFAADGDYQRRFIVAAGQAPVTLSVVGLGSSAELVPVNLTSCRAVLPYTAVRRGLYAFVIFGVELLVFGWLALVAARRIQHR